MSIKAMTWAWAQDIEARDKLVLLALADHADDDGICWPGIKGVAKKNRIGERATQRRIAALQATGLLRVERQYRPDGGFTTNLYFLLLTPPGVTMTPPSDTTSLVTPAPPPGDTGTTSLVTRASSQEPSGEPSENHHPYPSTGEEEQKDEAVWPDWYATLYEIPGFKRPFKEAAAWLQAKGISEEHAEVTAYALKGKWNPKAWSDPWATFQNWCKRPPLNGGKANGGTRPYPQPHEERPLTVYHGVFDADGEPILGR